MNAIVGLMTIAEFVLAGGKVTKVRLLADKVYTSKLGYHTEMTVSYITGLVNGHEVWVDGFQGLTGTKSEVKSGMIDYAKEYGLYIKPTGLLEDVNWDIF